MKALYCVLVATALTGCVAGHSVAPSDRRHLLAITGVPFDKSSPLSLSVERAPSEQVSFPASDQLVVRWNGEIDRTIQRIDDLGGFVAIESNSEALAFVRLLTDKRLRRVGLPEWIGWEISETHFPAGLDVPLANEVWQQIGWHSPLIRKTEERWSICRLILKRAAFDEKDQIVEVLEEVDSAGTYTRAAEQVRYEGTIDVGQHVFEL